VKQLSWHDVLKVLPPSPPFKDYGGYPEVDGTHVSNTPQRYDIGTTAIIVRGHYLDRVGKPQEHGTTDTNTDEMERWIKCFINKGKGSYYIYRNNRPDSYSIILVDIIKQGDKLPNTQNKTLNRSIVNAQGEAITKMIIFTNYFNSKRGIPKGRIFVPCNEQNEKKKLHKPRRPSKEPEMFNPFAPNPKGRNNYQGRRRPRRGN
jgi:hypothetical protein